MKLKVFFLYLIISLAAICPQFLAKYPGLLDDGSDLHEVKTMSFGDILYHQFLTEDRTRPIRYVYRKILFSAFGTRVDYHYLVSAVILALICFLMYLVLLKLKLNKKMAFGSVLILFFLPTLWTNFYRLGTDEPLQLLFLLAGTYLILNGKRLWALLFFGLNLLVKETSIFFMVIPILDSIVSKKIKNLLITAGVMLAYGSLIFYKLSLPRLSYIGRAGFSFDVWWNNFQFCSARFYIWAIITAGYVYIFKKAKTLEQKKISVIFGGMMAVSMVPALIWKMTMDYYYIVFDALAIIGGVYLVRSLLKGYSNKRVITATAILTLACLIYIFVQGSLRKISWFHKKAVVDSQLVSVLLPMNCEDKDIFVSIPDFEATYKIKSYLDVWKKDWIKNFYPEMDKWALEIDNGNKSDFNDMYLKSIENFMNDDYTNKFMISNREIEVLKPKYREEKICASSWLIGYQCGYYIYSNKE